ncbi:MAG: hypothetical protein WCI05_12770 [Myxococcales bacterium]
MTSKLLLDGQKPEPATKPEPTKEQNVYLSVPTSAADSTPCVKLLLGAPKRKSGEIVFGYSGVSLKTTKHLYLGVEEESLWHLGKAATVLASGEWYQYIGGEAFTSGKDKISFVSGSLLTLAAGPAVKGEKPDDRGNGPPGPVRPGRLKMQSLLSPMVRGVESFEATSDKGFASLAEGLGRKPPGGKKAGKVAWNLVLARFLGTAAPKAGTDAHYVERFGPPEHGVLGLLGRLNGRLEGLEARLQKIPLAQPLLSKIKKVKGLIDQTMDTVKDAQVKFEKAPWSGVPGDYKKVEGTFVKPVKDLIDPKKNVGDKAMAVVKLAAAPAGVMKTLTKSIRQMVTDVREVIDSVRDLATSALKLLDLVEEDPSSLGLFAKEGITLATPDRIVQYAADGFSFISADTKKYKPGNLLEKGIALLDAPADMLDKGTKKIKNLLSPFKLPKGPDSIPGFRVRTTHVDLRGNEANLSAVGAGASARVESAGQTEIAAMQEVLVSSRNAELLLLGDRVSIGAPPDMVRDLVGNPVSYSALLVASELLATARLQWNAAKGEVAEAEDALTEAKRDLKAAKGAAAKLAGTTEVKAKELLKDAADLKLKTLETAVELAITSLKSLRKPFTTLPSGFGSTDTKAHSAAQVVTIGGWERVEVAGGKNLNLGAVDVSIAAKGTLVDQGHVEIKAESTLSKATIELKDKVTIQVGLTTILEIGDGTVVVKINGSEVVKVDTLGGVVIKDPVSGNSKITTDALGVTVKGTKVAVEGDIVLIG